MPAYGLQLLLSFHTVVNQQLLVTLSQILQSRIYRVDNGIVLSMLRLLDRLVSTKDVDVSSLYDQGLIGSLVLVFADITLTQN